MNKIVELLEKKASSLREAVTPKSDDSWDLTKSAALATLKEQGIEDAETLIDGLMKEAGFDDTQDSLQAFPIDVEEVITLIEKTAAYIGELQVKIDAKDSKISDLHDELEKAASANSDEISERLASKGFSKEELEDLKSLPSNLLQKVASINSDESPWDMGQGARQAQDSLDPLAQFILS